MPEITYNRDAVVIRTDTATLYAYPPVPDKSGLRPFWRAALAVPSSGSYNLSKDEAELLARTIAPHLFEASDE
jgi:hypothetical protein